jgi:hypothetical protein
LSHATVRDVRTGAGTRIRYNDFKMGKPVIPRSCRRTLTGVPSKMTRDPISRQNRVGL